MRRELYEEGGDRNLVLILGWGNQLEHETVRWLLDRVLDAGYRVHAFQIPVVVTDFDADYLDPVAAPVADLDEYRLLTHSTGGLIGEFLDSTAPVTKVHLSPWWGFHGDLQNPLVSLAMKLPVSTPMLPAGIDGDDLGTHVTASRVADNPDRAAPTFLREAKRAQERLPPFDAERTTVFYTPSDPVVGTDAIEARAPPENRVAYEGGHEFFASATREDHVDDVLAALDEGPDAV